MLRLTKLTPNEVFLDTAYAVALTSLGDTYHAQAVSIAYELKALPTRLVTTRAVLMEIGNALSGLRFRHVAVQLLASLESDNKVEIIPLSGQLYALAFKLYSARPDKAWGMVDCISFVVMQQRGITDALTSDTHFQQAGFRALLREDI